MNSSSPPTQMSGPGASDQRVAVLVDCDNTKPEVLEYALRVVAQFGRVVVRRGYGNHSTLANKWQEALVRLAFTPCLQYQYASGKNTADIALALDAVEAMFDNRADAFCLVTSDSDFAYLCRKLRERGALVYIVGEPKSPAALRNASDQFFEYQPPERAQGPAASQRDGANRSATGRKARQIPPALIEAVMLLAAESSDGQVGLGPLGQYLKRTDPAFSPKAYGYSGLQDMLQASGKLVTVKIGSGIWVSLKPEFRDTEPDRPADRHAAEMSPTASLAPSNERRPSSPLTSPPAKTQSQAPARGRMSGKAGPKTADAAPQGGQRKGRRGERREIPDPVSALHEDLGSTISSEEIDGLLATALSEDAADRGLPAFDDGLPDYGSTFSSTYSSAYSSSEPAADLVELISAQTQAVREPDPVSLFETGQERGATSSRGTSADVAPVAVEAGPRTTANAGPSAGSSLVEGQGGKSQSRRRSRPKAAQADALSPAETLPAAPVATEPVAAAGGRPVVQEFSQSAIAAPEALSETTSEPKPEAKPKSRRSPARRRPAARATPDTVG